MAKQKTKPAALAATVAKSLSAIKTVLKAPVVPNQVKEFRYANVKAERTIRTKHSGATLAYTTSINCSLSLKDVNAQLETMLNTHEVRFSSIEMLSTFSSVNPEGEAGYYIKVGKTTAIPLGVPVAAKCVFKKGAVVMPCNSRIMLDSWAQLSGKIASTSVVLT
jgi:hypothetical protein